MSSASHVNGSLEVQVGARLKCLKYTIPKWLGLGWFQAIAPKSPRSLGFSFPLTSHGTWVFQIYFLDGFQHTPLLLEQIELLLQNNTLIMVQWKMHPDFNPTGPFPLNHGAMGKRWARFGTPPMCWKPPPSIIAEVWYEEVWCNRTVT